MEKLKELLKSKAYWKGVIKSTALPPVKALVDSTDATWDNKLYNAAESFIDLLLPDA